MYMTGSRPPPRGGGGAGPERHSRVFWVELCRPGFHTLTLFKIKIVYFATLFKTRDLILRS